MTNAETVEYRFNCNVIRDFGEFAGQYTLGRTTTIEVIAKTFSEAEEKVEDILQAAGVEPSANKYWVSVVQV